MKKTAYIYVGLFLLAVGWFSKSALLSVQNEQDVIKVVPVTILSIVDGDTVKAYYKGRQESIRLIGVDTPETHHPSKTVQPYGPEAEEYTRSQLAGKQVYLETDVQERDKYGRVLAYIWLVKPVASDEEYIKQNMFNARLLINGYAQILTVPPNIKYVDTFKYFQQQARKNNSGLWGLAASGYTTTKDTTLNSQKTENVHKDYFVGSAKSDKFHYPYCSAAKKIKDTNLVEFKSREDAIKNGYVPCKICNP